jgi:hypothetical protein
MASYTTGTLSSSGATVTLSGGTWPTWAAGGTIVCDGQTRTIATRDSDTQVTVTEPPSPAWNGDTHSTTRSRIVGVWLHYAGNQNVVKDCFVRLGDFTFSGSANTRGSVGIFVEHHNARVQGMRVFGSTAAGEVGCLIAPGRLAINIEVDTTGAETSPGKGFHHTGDAVVEFEDNAQNDLANTSGEVRVTYSPGEIPVRIPAGSPTGWGDGGKLKIYTRESTSGTWTTLNAGQAYP